MKIARIRHLFYPDMPHDYFYELSQMQVRSGHTVDVITWLKTPMNPAEEKISDNFWVHRLNGVNLVPACGKQDYPFLPGLPLKLEQVKPEVVHGESHLFLPTIQALRKAKNLKIPCVITVHGVFADRGFSINTAQNLYLHTLGLATLRSADKIICLTKSDASQINKLGCKSEKIVIVQNAVATDYFKPLKNIDEDLIVWVGRFVEEKGVKYLIEAARNIALNRPDTKILLIGYGPLKSKIIEMAQSFGLLNKSIFIGGPLGRDKIAQILGKAAIFVFPSSKEGMPISLLEAMSCELPVVAFDVPGIAEIIDNGKTGIMVQPRNSQQLAEAVIDLLNNKAKRKELGVNSRKYVIQNNSWETVQRSLDKVYSDAVDGNR